MSNNNCMLLCYNRSCGQQFDPDKNTPESCLHHPGFPVFHDAYKKWSCCEKKTTDFTEFLNIKGCTKSYHSNVKPPEPPKPVPKADEVQPCPQPLQQKEVFIRPDGNQPLTQLSFTIGASLKPVLDKMKKEAEQQNDKKKDSSIQLNAPCLNKGCREGFKGEESNSETCLYHSGVPVFHEGMKYWSCCVKRTTDFNSFLDQVGCTAGKHKWTKEDDSNSKTNCRYDWHQTGNSVVISIYAKCPYPDLSFVEANPVKLHIHITFGEKKSVFDEEMCLFGVVDVSNCTVTYLGSKVEIKLKKAGPALSWKNLTLEKENLPGIETINIQDGGDKQ